MNKTRLLAGILAALMLLPVLAACGTPVEEPTVTNDVTAGADVTETELARNCFHSAN